MVAALGRLQYARIGLSRFDQRQTVAGANLMIDLVIDIGRELLPPSSVNFRAAALLRGPRSHAEEPLSAFRLRPAEAV